MKNIKIIILAFILSFPNNNQMLHHTNEKHSNRLIEVNRAANQMLKPIRFSESVYIPDEVKTYIEQINEEIGDKKDEVTDTEDENPEPSKPIKKSTPKKAIKTKNAIKKHSGNVSPSSENIRLLALICMAEAEGECEYGQRLVIDTVLNRVDSDKFPNSIYGVIYQKNQFTSMWNGRANRIKLTERFYKLAEEELRNRTNYDCIFFTAGQYSNYGRPMFRVENHYFSSYK